MSPSWSAFIQVFVSLYPSFCQWEVQSTQRKSNDYTVLKQNHCINHPASVHFSGCGPVVLPSNLCIPTLPPTHYMISPWNYLWKFKNLFICEYTNRHSLFCFSFPIWTERERPLNICRCSRSESLVSTFKVALLAVKVLGRTQPRKVRVLLPFCGLWDLSCFVKDWIFASFLDGSIVVSVIVFEVYYMMTDLLCLF